MESLGWVVGAPGAAARATMITVLAAGNLGAALVGGGVLGAMLRQQVPVPGKAAVERNPAKESGLLF